jgi:hypothetical protein
MDFKPSEYFHYGAATSGCGGFCYLRGRQLRAKALAQQVWADARSPVIFLRSFESDGPDAENFVPTEEELLAKAVNGIGPLIAIGKPGETLPKLGAMRLYVPDAIWQQTVKEKLKEARLIVVQAGMSEGLWWEISQCLLAASPDKVVLFFWKMPRISYNIFASRFEDNLSIKLPSIAHGDQMSGIIIFNDQWEPECPSIDIPFWRNSLNHNGPWYSYAFRPVFIRLGIKWSAPSVALGNIVIVVISSLLITATLFLVFK